METPAASRHRMATRRRPTAGDLLLLALLIAAVPLSRRATASGPGSERLVLRSEPAGVQVVDARRDGDFELAGPLGTTRLRLRGGAAWIVESPCPGQLCRRMGRIGGPGRVLACVPNRVLVQFEGHTADVDGVSR